MIKPQLVRTAVVSAALAAWTLAAGPSPARADAGDDTRPAFSLSSDHIATTREHPRISLMFRRVSSLDFRVYRVEDPLKFFAGLRDPHALGSEAPVVPQEQTVIERIADWKASWRETILSFFRGQFSPRYRHARREASDRKQVALRQPLDYRQFAQVPLLNASQLVASWRELLPMVRESEGRQIPLDLPGEGVYVVEAVAAPARAYTVVIVSDLGLVTKASPSQLVMFAANRFTGEPAAGCQAEVLANRTLVASGALGADGTFEAALPDGQAEDVVAIARCGRQVAATDPGSWFFHDKARELMGYIYTDKPIYRPGHTVHLKGILRWRVGDALARFDRKQVEVRVGDPNDKVVLRQTVAVDEFGAVLATIPIPRGAALGSYAVHITSQDDSVGDSFEVQEYRKPEFEVIVEPSSRFVVQGGKAMVHITARYYFGQPVANGLATVSFHRQPYYSPLRYDDDAEEDPGRPRWWFGGDKEGEQTLRLDAQGTADVAVPLDVNEDGRDYSVRVEAGVADASSREVSGNTIVHATYGRVLVVASADDYVYAPGAQATVSIRTLDYVGTPQPNLRMTVAVERLSYPQGRWDKPVTERLSTSALATDADGHAVWTVALPHEPGDYLLKAETTVDGRVVSDSAWAWVSGWRGVQEAGDEDRELELVADKRSYQPGDVAHLVVKGDATARAVLVTKEARHVSWRQVARPAKALAVDVPITEEDLGDTYVNVAFLKDDRLYRAEKRVRIPATARQLAVTITADHAVAKPRQPAAFTVKVVDARGQPVRAQVSLGVIDEAVYGVRPDDTPDPLRAFYRREYLRVGTQFSREYSFVGYSGSQRLQLAQRRRTMALADFKGDKQARPQVRKEFPDAIFWTGDLVTGADGTARVQLTYPDSLTTWRVTARVVTADTLVGSTVARTMVTKDLIVRVVTPRFLTEGDEVVVPTVVHNYLPSAKTVAITMKADGVSIPAGQTAPAPQSVEVAQAGEHRDDWRFLASRVGTATFTATATTDADGDAVELPVQVLPFGLKRTAGAAGSIVGPGERSAQLTIPTSANPSARTIRVSLAPSLAGPMLGALDFLTGYPYGCTEQTLSGFLPDLLVMRALDQLKIAPTERMQSLDRQVSEGVKRLYDYQHDDGGWGWWKTDETHPFMTAYALYGLVEARRAGVKVEPYRIASGTRALRKLFAEYPRAVPDLKAYMAYVLAVAESAEAAEKAGQAHAAASDQSDSPRPGRAAVDETWPTRDRMSPYGQALLALALEALGDARADEMLQRLAASVQRKGDLAWWSVDRDPLLDDYGDTSVEATAFAVKAVAGRDPKSPLLEPAVRWMLLNRSSGAWWSTTKQTAMALYGLLDYMKARNEGAADSTVEVLVNGASVGTRTFTSASLTEPDPVTLTAPAAAGANTVVVRAKGGGSVYWSASAEYFDTAGPFTRTGSRKLALVRQYFALTPVKVGDRILYRQAPFSGTAKPGDLLLVRLDAAGAADWRYLMIEDPLPAGAEAVQDRTLYPLEQPRDFWDGSRREYRDDRIVFFQESFSRGHYEYLYLLKVVTPGVFRAMPAQITAMYVPDANASSEPQTLAVGADPRLAGARK